MLFKKQELIRGWEGHPEAFISPAHGLKSGDGCPGIHYSLNCTQHTLYTLPYGCFISNKTGFWKSVVLGHTERSITSFRLGRVTNEGARVTEGPRHSGPHLPVSARDQRCGGSMQ